MSQNLRRTIVIEGVRYHDDRPKWTPFSVMISGLPGTAASFAPAQKKKKGETQFLNFKWSVPVYDSEEAYLIEKPVILGNFLNSMPDAMEIFIGSR